MNITVCANHWRVLNKGSWSYNDSQVTTIYICINVVQNCFIWINHNHQRQLEEGNKHNTSLSCVFHTKMKIYYCMLARSCLNLCLQVLNSSDRSFRLAVSGWKIIKYFSLVHKLHFLVTGLKSLALPSIFQFTLKFLFLSCSSNIWVESVVECSFSRFEKLYLWP